MIGQKNQFPLLTRLYHSGLRPEHPSHADEPGWIPFQREFMVDLTTAANIDASWAAKRFIREEGGEYVTQNVAESLTIVPPFEKYWMEYTIGREQFGGLFIAERKLDPPHGWELLVNGVRGPTNEAPYHFGLVACELSTQGEIFGPLRMKFPKITRETNPQEATMARLLPLLFVHRFFGCNNIKLDRRERDDLTPRGQRRKRPTDQKFTYHVLLVKRSTRRGCRNPGAAGAEAWNALHTVRGNFARYSADRPCFGKLTGEFWRPAHARGDVARGIADKDYRL